MAVSALQYARAAWRRGVYTSLREVLRAMKEGGEVDMRLVNRMMSDILDKTEGAMEEIGTARFERITKSATPNYFGLFEMLKERTSYYSDRLNDYRFLVKKFDNPGIAIGRRGQDVVREISLETLEEGFLRGNPTAFTETALLDRLVNSKNAQLFPDRATAEVTMKAFQKGVIDKIPLFHEDGEAKFLLRIRHNGEYVNPPKYQAWSAEKYADLVAITTAGEADAAANMEQAREIGTRLIKWNSTGKGKAFYESIGDYRCAKVDGEIASLEENGTTINGVTYPYWRTLLPGPFNTCHPRCRHRFVALPESAVGSSPNPPDAAEPRIIQSQKTAESYGVKRVNFGSAKNQEIADQVNQVLKRLVDSGQPVPERLVIDHKEFQQFREKSEFVPAMFVRKQAGNPLSSVIINPRASLWKDVESQMRDIFAKGEWSSSHPLHVVNHEIGHFLHNNDLGNATYQLFKETLLTGEQRKLIMQEVSFYAATNPLEFVAETYAGLVAGRKFSDAIMALYARFGGVKV